jgi:putative transposase
LRPCERRRQGRQAEPSAGSGDSQSIKTASQATEVGFDGGQQVKGRQRPLVVDTLGLLSAVVGTAANTEDRVGLMLLLRRYFVGGARRLRKVGVDGGSQAEGLTQWVRDLKPSYKIDLAVTSHEGKGFQGVPWRWAVERTFAWLLTDRRHSRDYETLTANSEAMIQLSMIRLLLNRLA